MEMAGDDRDTMVSVDRAERAVPQRTKPHRLSSRCDCARVQLLWKSRLESFDVGSVDADDGVTLVMDCYAPRTSLKQLVRQ